MPQKAKVVEAPQPPTLPHVGKSRWSAFKPFSPICLGTFLKLSKEGKAPQPERLGSRAVFFDNSELHRWLQSPADYTVGGQ
jgi:prophage regulatory protein